ncbi:MAG: hypothetical protein K1X83_04240 [Oligoflexia bacterium]|nr:hypothetical protein [Oligoflexia bacterium]
MSSTSPHHPKVEFSPLAQARLRSLFGEDLSFARPDEWRTVLDRSEGLLLESLNFIQDMLEEFQAADAEFCKTHRQEIVDAAVQLISSEHDWHERSELFKSASRALSDPASQAKLHLLEDLAGYHGSIPFLNSFLEKAGTLDPYEACTRMKVDVYTKDTVPRGLLVYEEGRQRLRAAGRNDVGQLLSLAGHTYCVEDPLREGTTILYKRQAFLAIFATFRPDEFSEIRSAQDADERKSGLAAARRRFLGDAPKSMTLKEYFGAELYERRGLAAFENVPLAELEAHADFQRLLAKNPVLARELLVHKELNSLFNQFAGDTDKILARAALLGRMRIGRIEFGEAGFTLERIERLIARSEDPGSGIEVPHWVKDSFALLSDTAIKISAVKERRLFDGLSAWLVLNSTVNKALVFGGMREDMEHFQHCQLYRKQLPEAHPVHTFNFDFSTGQLALASLQGEITFREAKQLGATAWAQKAADWRQLMADYNAHRFAAPLAMIEVRFWPLFKTETAAAKVWREDSRGDHLPLARLRKEEPYAVPIFQDGKALVGALSQQELKAIFEFMTVAESNANLSTVLGAYALKHSEKMVRALVRAVRFADLADQHAISTVPPSASGEELSRAELCAKLVEQGPVSTPGRIFNSALMIVEDLDLDGKLGAAPADRFQELLTRLQSRPPELFQRGKHRDLRARLDWHAKVGLCEPRAARLLQELEPKVLDLMPLTQEKRQQLDFAQALFDSPLLRFAPILPGMPEKPGSSMQQLAFLRSELRRIESAVRTNPNYTDYLNPGELQGLEEVYRLGETARRRGLVEWDHVAGWRVPHTHVQLMQNLKELRTGQHYVLKAVENGRVIVDTAERSEQEDGLVQEAGLQFYDPALIVRAIGFYASKFERGGNMHGTSGRSLEELAAGRLFWKPTAYRLAAIGTDLLRSQFFAHEILAQLEQPEAAIRVGQFGNFEWQRGAPNEPLSLIARFKPFEGRDVMSIPLSYLEERALRRDEMRRRVAREITGILRIVLDYRLGKITFEQFKEKIDGELY